MDLVARHYETGRWVRLGTAGATLSEVAPADGPAEVSASDDWVAPAFWDIQLNGRLGVSFSDQGLTVDQVATVVRAQTELGTARLCPTLISAPEEALRHGLATIADACERFPDVAAMVVGIHLEGPFLSAIEGYRGAHPAGALRDPDWPTFERWQSLSGGRIALITLAPERPGSIEFIRQAVARNVVVALGHTAADGPTIRAAAEAGARLSTHLGNGIATQLPRHPNPIWEQAAHDDLLASLIADGHHLDSSTLRALVRAKTPERIILVSDASPLAGLPPGRYGEWAVDPSGKIVVAGTPYLAGSNQALRTGLNVLIRAAQLTLPEAIATVTRHPARLLGHEPPSLAPGKPANFVRFRVRGPEIDVLGTCVDGETHTAR
jgi:N-acetylglucosamine-6-phosphate deacetylase